MGLMYSPDVHSPQTVGNLASLLAAPINSYQSVLTLLAIPRYSSLLSQQPYSTRRSLSHAVISSILKNETIIETPEDVNGVLELCHVLIKDQSDSGLYPGTTGQQPGSKDSRRQGPYPDKEDIAEEQGWVARMVHLFRADTVDTQYEVIAAPSIVLPFLFFHSFYKPQGNTSIWAENECGSLSLRLLPPRSSCVDGARIKNTW